MGEKGNERRKWKDGKRAEANGKKNVKERWESYATNFIVLIIDQEEKGERKG